MRLWSSLFMLETILINFDIGGVVQGVGVFREGVFGYTPDICGV